MIHLAQSLSFSPHSRLLFSILHLQSEVAYHYSDLFSCAHLYNNKNHAASKLLTNHSTKEPRI